MFAERLQRRIAHRSGKPDRERLRHEPELLARDEFSPAVLDSMTVPIAVLARNGTVLLTNQAWRRFAAGPGPHQVACSEVGANYTELCRRRGSREPACATSVSAGVQAVLEGCQDEFAFEYACPVAGAPRWFRMTVTPLRAAGGGAVVVHTDITDRVRAEQAVQWRETELRQPVRMDMTGQKLATESLIDISECKPAQDQVQRFIAGSSAVIYALTIDDDGVVDQRQRA